MTRTFDQRIRLTDVARALAAWAHGDQKDKIGEPYIEHPLAVARKATQYAAAAGWDSEQTDFAYATGCLHDVLEDTYVTVELLRAVRLPDPVVTATVLLTRTIGQSPQAYYARVRSNPLALLVKQADLWHNTLPQRLDQVPDRTRLERKYAVAHDALGLARPQHLLAVPV